MTTTYPGFAYGNYGPADHSETPLPLPGAHLDAPVERQRQSVQTNRAPATVPKHLTAAISPGCSCGISTNHNETPLPDPSGMAVNKRPYKGPMSEAEWVGAYLQGNVGAETPLPLPGR